MALHQQNVSRIDRSAYSAVLVVLGLLRVVQKQPMTGSINASLAEAPAAGLAYGKGNVRPLKQAGEQLVSISRDV